MSLCACILCYSTCTKAHRATFIIQSKRNRPTNNSHNWNWVSRRIEIVQRQSKHTNEVGNGLSAVVFFLFVLVSTRQTTFCKIELYTRWDYRWNALRTRVQLMPGKQWEEEKKTQFHIRSNKTKEKGMIFSLLSYQNVYNNWRIDCHSMNGILFHPYQSIDQVFKASHRNQFVVGFWPVIRCGIAAICTSQTMCQQIHIQ